ncbi:TonB-dependent receptor [Fulvivirga sp. 29W222]|uniref:TonB-dependent receptor n=1 Tax=Fulvivirga marina TaxID=2494733 RepID=A0A937G2K4_9BACT|nr:TonB-dependent receptor [Fulvivirga marina]MBL6449527.1 TonB-dependent receptor [Fulvivirga marina]
MKDIITIFSLCIITMTGLAQSNISGRVTDSRGEPVIGANIFIVDSYDGTSSDVQGFFSFSTSEQGSLALRITYIGYETYEMPIELPSEAVVLDITLTEKVNRLDAVVISAGLFTAGEESSREVLKSLDIVTTAGATADISGALNTLPGTQIVGETGRLFVRGGEGNETKTFIDGIEVLNPYSSSAPNTPGRGRFSPFMFRGTSFSTGGYSAEYGQALSSALVLNSKDVPDETRTDISLMTVGADVSHTREMKEGAFAGKLQYTNLTPYFKAVDQNLDWDRAPQSIEGNFMLRKALNDMHELKMYSNFSWSDFVVYQPRIIYTSAKDKMDLTNNYQYINTSLRSIINDQWSVFSGISYTKSNERTHVNDEKYQEREEGIHLKTVIADDVSDELSLQFGGEHFIRDYSYENIVQPDEELGIDLGLTALFAEMDLYTSNRFVTRAGIRGEYNWMQDMFYVVPRLSIAYKTGENSQMSVAYGQFNQTGRNDLVRIKNSLEDERADHYIINYQREENGRTFRVEAYYKNYDNLIKFSQSYNPDSYTNNGDGYARGIDVFWRDNKTLKGVDYWLSYSYLDTERDYHNFPYQAAPTFASEHNFSAVFKYFINALKTQLGGTYSYASGRPFNNPNLELFNSEKTADYHDLSLNASYLLKSNVIIHGSVTNVFGFDNIFGFESSNEPNENGEFILRPVKQAAPRFIFLGVFITLSKDKSVNQLPTL